MCVVAAQSSVSVISLVGTTLCSVANEDHCQDSRASEGTKALSATEKFNHKQ